MATIEKVYVYNPSSTQCIRTQHTYHFDIFHLQSRVRPAPRADAAGLWCSEGCTEHLDVAVLCTVCQLYAAHVPDPCPLAERVRRP